MDKFNNIKESVCKISIIIPTYNCNHYLRKTIESVLSQDLGPELMEIEVVDDCSQESPEYLISKIGKGRVKLFRQLQNVGHVKNFETGIKRAKGDIIHLLHGDDYILPGFYKAMLGMYQVNPDIGACYCRHFFVDEGDNITSISELSEKNNVVLSNFYKTLIHGQRIQTPSITVKKHVYEKLGTFNPTLTWTEDWEMWVRISKEYPIGYIKEPLAAYRIHKNSSTGTKTITGANVTDLLRLRKIFTKYTDNVKERKALEKSFKKIIFNVSANNYRYSKSIHHREAYKHLLTMSRNSISLKSKILFFINYIVKQIWI